MALKKEVVFLSKEMEKFYTYWQQTFEKAGIDFEIKERQVKRLKQISSGYLDNRIIKTLSNKFEIFLKQRISVDNDFIREILDEEIGGSEITENINNDEWVKI